MEWLAGLLEGEGCFDINVNGDPRIRLEMTDKDVVERAHGIMGGRGMVRTIRRVPPHNDTYQCTVSGKQARLVLSKIMPLMGRRRTRKIEYILSWPSGKAAGPEPASPRFESLRQNRHDP